MKTAIRLIALLLALVMCLSAIGCTQTTTEEFISVWEDVEDDTTTDETEADDENDSDEYSEETVSEETASKEDTASKTETTSKEETVSKTETGSKSSTATSSKVSTATSSKTSTATSSKVSTATSSKTSSKTNSKTSSKTNSKNDTVVSTPANSDEYVDADNLELRKEYESKHDVYNNPKLKGSTVKFATWIDHRTTEAKHAMETFEKATGIKVEWVEVSQFGYLDSLVKLVAAKNAPDVWVTVGDSFPNEFQIAQPIDKISTFDIKDPIWNKDWMDTYKVGNHYYMVNTVNSIWCGADLVFYNRNIFEDNGLLTPKDYEENGEWSLEAMLEIMKSVDALGDKYYGGLIDPKLVGAALGAGIGYWRDGKIQSGVNNDKTYQAWKYFYQALELGYYQRGVTMTDFSQGRVGMWMADVYALKNSGYSIGDSESLSWISLPSKVNKNDEDSGCISAIPRGYGVCTGAKNPEGAVIFLRYFLDPLNYDWDATFKNEEAKEFYLQLIDVSKDQRVYDIIGCNPVSAAIKEGTLAYKLTNTTGAQLKTTLDSIAPEVNAKIKEYNKMLDEIIARDK